MEDSSQTAITRAEAAGQILLSGLGDWVSFDEALGYVRDDHAGSTRQESLRAALGVLETLLRRGLVVAGDLTPEFVARKTDASGSLGAISRAAQEQRPGIGSVCWLANTPVGDELAEIIRQEDPVG